MLLRKSFAALAFFVFAGGAHAGTGGYDLNTPVGTLAENPAAAAVVNKDVPDLLSNSNYSTFKVLSLKQIAALSGGKLTKQMLGQTETDLKALAPATPVQKISY